MMMLSRVQYCRSLPRRPPVIPAYSFLFFIWPGQFLIFLVIIMQQQSRALAHLQTTKSSSTATTNNWDILPSNTFTRQQSPQSYSTAVSPSPTFDRVTKRSSQRSTKSDHASIKISNGNFNEMTLQNPSLTRDSTSVLSMTPTPNSIGFHAQLSASGCVSSHCRLESSSSFTISGTVIPILGRPTSSQLTPKSSSRLNISGSPLAGPTSAMKTSSPGFIIMADGTATTMGSHHRLKKKRHRKRKKKKRKKKRKKKKSRRKGRKTTAQWGVEELRKTTQTARTKKKSRVKWVTDRRRNSKYPTQSPAAILSSAILKSVSSLAPVQKLMTPSFFPSKMISRPTSPTEVMEKTSQTIKPTPVFKASRVPAKQTMTLPNLISSRLLQTHMIKPHLPTPPLPLTTKTANYDELSQVLLNSASFIHPSLTKNQIPTSITNSNTHKSLNIPNYETTPYFMTESSESKTISPKFSTLSSSFSFHSIHESDFSSFSPFETSPSSLKDYPDEDKSFHTINLTKSSNMEPPQSQLFSQREISIHPTPTEQSSLLHPPTNQKSYINSTKSVNSSKYTVWQSVLVYQARRPPIIEKSFKIDEKTLIKSKSVDNSVFHTLSEIHSSNSFVEPEFSHSVFSTVSDKSVSKTEFPSSLTPLSVSDVSENLDVMDFLHFIDTALNYTNTNDSNSTELPFLNSSASNPVSLTSGLSSFNSLFPLMFPSQIRAKHERTRKSADLSLSSKEITPKNDLLNNFEHLKEDFSKSVDQSVYTRPPFDYVSNSVPSSKLHPGFSKGFPEADISSFDDSVNPVPISPSDLFAGFDLTDSSQPHSWSDIHSTIPLGESPPLQTSFPAIYDTDHTHTSLPVWFTSQLTVDQHNRQTANALRDEKIFNLVFDSQKIQNNKHSSDIYPHTDISASDITNNLIHSSSLLLSLEQESKSTSNIMSSYSEENMADFSLFPTMMSDQDSSHNSVEILSSSFLEIVTSDLASPESSLEPNIPNMSSLFMPLESSMFSVTSSTNDLSPSLLESFSQSLNSVLITEGDLNMASSTDDSSNPLFSMLELSNLSFPSAAGVNPDSWTASELSRMDSRALINDSNSQVVYGDVSITNEQLTSSEYINEKGSMSRELSVSTNQFVDYQEFSISETSSFDSTDLPSQSKLFDSSWTFDSDTVEDKLVFTSYPISGMIPPDSESVHSSTVQLTPYLSSNFVLESSSASPVWMLPSSSLPQWLEDVNAMVDPASFGSGDMISSDSFDYFSSIDVASGNWDFPLPDQFLESSLSSPEISSSYPSSPQISSSYLESSSQLINQYLFTSQAEKSSHQSTMLPNSSSHLYSSFSPFEPSEVISSQPILIPISSQESSYIESSQLISEPSPSLLLELSDEISPSLYWLDTSSVASEQFPWFEASDSTLSVMVEQSQPSIKFLFEVESSEWTSQVESSPASESLFHIEAISLDIDSTEIQSQSEYLSHISQLSPQLETLQPTSQLESSTYTSDLSAAFGIPAMIADQQTFQKSTRFMPVPTLQIIPNLLSQFTSQTSSKIEPSLASQSQYTTQVSLQSTSQMSSQLTPFLSLKFTPEISSQFTPESSSQFTPSLSSQFRPEISSQFTPSLSSQFRPEISSQFTPSLSSQFIPQIPSQIMPSLSSEFTPQMSSEFTPQISSQIIPSQTSQLETQMSESLELTSQLDSSHPVLSWSETLQSTSSELFSQTEYPQRTLQFSTESISHTQSSFSISQSSLQSDSSHQSSPLSSYPHSSDTSLHPSSYPSKLTTQSTPLFSPELEPTHSTISSSQLETSYSTPDLTSQIMSSDPQLDSTSLFPHSIHPTLNSSWFSLRTQSTLETGMISVSSFDSTLMPTISVTKTLSREFNSTSLFHPTTKFVNHSTSDVNKSTTLTTPFDVTLPTTPEPMLNLSQAFQNYWVITVIKVRLSVNISTMTFRKEMERNLARAYAEAYHIGARILNGTFQPLRKKRYVLIQDIALQMISISRTPTNSSNNVTMVYYMEKGGKPVPAVSAARHLKLLQSQELAIHLKQVVVLPARTYLNPPHPEPSKDWIIGAVLGTLASALFLIWCILFIYFKCFRMRPTKSINTKSATPQLVLSTSMQDVNTDTSETVLIRDELQIHRQASLLKKNGLKKQTYSVALPNGGKKGKKESERDETPRDISGGKKKIKAARKTVNGKISKKAEMKSEVKINVDNIPLKQNGHVIMGDNEYSKETDAYSDYEVEPPSIQMPPPLSMNGCTNTDRLSPFHYVNLPPIQHNFSLTASRQEPLTRFVPQSSSDYMADDELRYQANHLRRIQKQRLKEERRKMRHVELYQNSPHFFLNQGQDMEVVSNGLRTETVDESHLEESRRGSRRRRYKRREKPDFSSQEDSSLNGAYDGDEPETLQRTREKMHKLLDDAFQLIARHEKKKISPSITPLGSGCTRKSSIGKRRTRRQRPTLLETPSIPCHRKSSPSDSTPEEKLDRLHTPLFLHNHYSPCNRHRVNPGIPPPWNAAGDEAAKIAAEHQAWSSPYVSPRLNRPKILLNTSDPRDEMRLPTISYPSDHNLTDFGGQPTFSFSRPILTSQFSPYASSRPFQNRHSGYHSVENSDDTPTSLFQPSTPCYTQNIENSIELNTFEPPSFAKHLSRSPASSKASPIDDEIDAVHNNVKQEGAPQPLIQSIRDELMRLSNENGERNSLRSRIVLG